LCQGLSEDQLKWRPQAGKWAIAELLVHLNLTTQTYAPPIEAALRDARAKGATSQAGEFPLGFIGAQFAKSMEPRRMKMRAPKMVQPLLQGPAVDALPQFLRSQELVLRMVDGSEGLDLGKVKFTSPYVSLLRLTVIAGFAVIAAHQRRHLWQAEQIANQLREQK